jgi:hypothetical protein
MSHEPWAIGLWPWATTAWARLIAHEASRFGRQLSRTSTQPLAASVQASGRQTPLGTSRSLCQWLLGRGTPPPGTTSGTALMRARARLDVLRPAPMPPRVDGRAEPRRPKLPTRDSYRHPGDAPHSRPAWPQALPKGQPETPGSGSVSGGRTPASPLPGNERAIFRAGPVIRRERLHKRANAVMWQGYSGRLRHTRYHEAAS